MNEPSVEEKTAGAPMQAVTPATKLHAPTRRGLVPRDDLVARLTDPGRILTLIEAPPGWGKTTLLTQWLSSPREDRPFAWVSLDRSDNDSIRFWDTVVAALRTILPGVGEAALPALRNRGVPASELALPLLINDLDSAHDPLVLVLDDYHVIANPVVHEALAFLLGNMPRGLHVAIATRSDPPLPLGRLRVEGAITEVRPASLRFTADEARALLNGSLGLGLEAGDIARLVERTEGWVAGLQLAALSLRDMEDRQRFIDRFAGDDRQIVDYLVTEVLARLPDDVRDFMVETSILERLSAPLCDAVTGRSDSAAMLERIERSNLFLVPLDEKREWYRYHHLFGQLLRHRLDRTAPGLAPALHARAFAWHREAGDVSEAIQHAAAAGEVEEAANLIAQSWFAFNNIGRLETVIGWLDLLPPDAVEADARLCIARALTSYLLGRLSEVDRWLDRAERGDFEGALPDRTASSVEFAVNTVRAAHRYFTGDVGAAAAAAGRVVEGETEGYAFLNNARGLLGGSYFWSGDRERAARVLTEVVLHGRPETDTIAMLHALGCLAAIKDEEGDVPEARRLSSEGVRLASERGLAHHFAASLAFTVRGRAALAAGAAEDAEALVRRGIELAGRGAGRLFTAYGMLSLARVLAARGDADGAAAAQAEAERTIAQCPDPGRLGRPARRGPAAHELSEGELKVLRLLATPMTQREIGGELFVSINTVKTHTRSIYRKLGVGSREEAVERARELSVI